MGLNVSAIYGVFGEQRNEMIARSKVILNHHFFETKILEMVRISFLLANRCAVLSEKSSNQTEDSMWSSGICFSEYSNLPMTAQGLINNDSKRILLSETGFKMIRERKIEDYLKIALKTLV